MLVHHYNFPCSQRTVREEVVSLLDAPRLLHFLHFANEAPDWQIIIKHLEVIILLQRLCPGTATGVTVQPQSLYGCHMIWRTCAKGQILIVVTLRNRCSSFCVSSLVHSTVWSRSTRNDRSYGVWICAQGNATMCQGPFGRPRPFPCACKAFRKPCRSIGLTITDKSLWPQRRTGTHQAIAVHNLAEAGPLVLELVALWPAERQVVVLVRLRRILERPDLVCEQRHRVVQLVAVAGQQQAPCARRGIGGERCASSLLRCERRLLLGTSCRCAC